MVSKALEEVLRSSALFAWDSCDLAEGGEEATSAACTPTAVGKNFGFSLSSVYGYAIVFIRDTYCIVHSTHYTVFSPY